MARSPVSNVIQSFNALTEDEKKLCLDFIAPEPEPEPQVKQTRKKRTTKSARAKSLSTAITSSLEAKADAPQVFNGAPCKANVPGLDVECGEPEEYPIHDPSAGYGGYHAFSLTAPVAEKKSSSRRGSGTRSAVSTETPDVAALAASGD